MRHNYIWRNKLKDLKGMKRVEWDVSNPMKWGDIHYILHA
jgi:hypothetical protein